MGRLVSRLFLLAISLFDRLATSPRPDLIFARALGGATVKGGRRPSLSDLPLTVVSNSARLARSVDLCRVLVRSSSTARRIPRGARHRARTSRAMMQSCASVPKLRGADPF